MGSLSNFAENALLDHVFNVAYIPTAGRFLALSTTDPLDDGSGLVEPVGGGYARASIVFGVESSRRVTGSNTITYPQVTGSQGTLAYWAIMDQLSFGNMLAHGKFVSAVTPAVGNVPKVDAGEVYVEIQATATGAGFTDYCVHQMLELMFRGTAWAKPATYVAMATAVLTDQDEDTPGDISEETGTDYLRKLVNINGGASPTWDLASGGALANTHAVTIIDTGDWTTDDWNEIVAAAIVTGAGASKILFYDNANIVDQTPLITNIVQFAVGALPASLT